jgi:hypothetical protein
MRVIKQGYMNILPGFSSCWRLFAISYGRDEVHTLAYQCTGNRRGGREGD